MFPHSLIPCDLTKVTNRFSLPDLAEVDFRLLANPAAPISLDMNRIAGELLAAGGIVRPAAAAGRR